MKHLLESFMSHPESIACDDLKGTRHLFRIFASHFEGIEWDGETISFYENKSFSEGELKDSTNYCRKKKFLTTIFFETATKELLSNWDKVVVPNFFKEEYQNWIRPFIDFEYMNFREWWHPGIRRYYFSAYRIDGDEYFVKYVEFQIDQKLKNFVFMKLTDRNGRDYIVGEMVESDELLGE